LGEFFVSTSSTELPKVDVGTKNFIENYQNLQLKMEADPIGMG
jgi:hypothetical protein